MIPGVRSRSTTLLRGLAALSVLTLIGCYDTLPPPGAFQGASGGDGGVGEVEIAVFRASPEMVALNETALITYNVRGASRLDLVALGGAPLFVGSSTLAGQVRTSSLTATTEFELTGYGEQETARARLTISVVPSAHAAILTATVSATVVPPGGSALFDWTTAGATRGAVRRIDGSNVYDIPAGELAAGRLMLRPAATTVYELAVLGADGQEVTESILLRVAAEGADRTARAQFDAEVIGVFEARCAACHADGDVRGPDYLGLNGRNGFYDALVADRRLLARPESSLLFLKGEHAGPALTPIARASIATWLLQEAEERGVPRPALASAPYAPRTLREALVRAGACLTRADWDATYGADTAGHTTEAAHEVATPRGGQGGGACFTCHTDGTGGVSLLADSAATWAEARRAPTLLKLFAPNFSAEGALLGLIAAGRIPLKGQDDLHPAFELGAARRDALSELTRRVLERFGDFTVRCDQDN